MNHQFIGSVEKLKEIFKNCNWKYTKQRSVLVQNIFNGPNKHFCVNTINEELKNNKIFFSYTTLFNNLNDLVEKNYLSRIECGNQYFYDTNTSKHIHWGIPDPARTNGNEKQILDAFSTVRDSILNHVKLFNKQFKE